MSIKTAHDLALFVYGRLVGDDRRPSSEVLDTLFQTLFFASLKTEESTPIACSIAYANPKRPDPDAPERIRDPRWRYTALAKPLAYRVGELAKLAMATDPSCSSLAIYPDRRGILRIWGLFDQQGGVQSLLAHESEEGFAPPGVLQAQIIGLGHIIVTRGLAVIGELSAGNLVEDSVDVFQGSIVSKKLAAGIQRRLVNISAALHDAGLTIDDELRTWVTETWVHTIRRILLRARGIGHGGAFLLTDSDAADGLKVKYAIHYTRIPALFENWTIGRSIQYEAEGLLRDELDQDSHHIEPTVYLDHVVAKGDADDAWEAIGGAVAFVASLSRVDGLVLLDTDLIVHGFGSEITAVGDKDCRLFRADHYHPTKGRPRRLDIEQFGTRHRSMIRYCTEDTNAVGFVVSNDGPVRAISRAGSRVYLWENVQLGLSIASGEA